MILLITPQSKGQDFADALYAATTPNTHWARYLQRAATRLREQN